MLACPWSEKGYWQAVHPPRQAETRCLTPRVRVARSKPVAKADYVVSDTAFSGTVPRVGRVTVLDGGTGRELARIGAPFSQPLWSAQALLEDPDYVRRVHESYVAAGAEVITTNTYAPVSYTHLTLPTTERV